MNIYLKMGLGAFAAAAVVAVVAYLPVDNTLQRLRLQSETHTCRDALETGLDSPTTDYCNDIIERYSAMVKAYKAEQLQQLIERAQEKG